MDICKIIGVLCGVATGFAANAEVLYKVANDITITYKESDQILNNNKAALEIDNNSNSPVVVEIDKKGIVDVVPAVVVPSGGKDKVDIKLDLEKLSTNNMKKNNSIMIKATKINGNIGPDDKAQTKVFIQEIKI